MKFLTPFNESNNQIQGALYDSEGYLETSSLRKVTIQGKYRPIDKASLTADEMSNAQVLEGNFIFLGHCHRHYGHFLLETLPMISGLIEKRDRRGVFLPFGFADNFSRQLLDDFLKIIKIDPGSILFHLDKSRIIKLRARCKKRPLLINKFDGLLEADSFKLILNEIKTCMRLNTRKMPCEKVFLDRDESRINQSIRGAAATYFAENGFKVVRPESLNVKEQIRLIHSAKVVVGYVGSQMHNSLFCQPSTRVVCLGDSLYPRKQLPNQVLCNQISGVFSNHVDYTDDADQLISHLSNILK